MVSANPKAEEKFIRKAFDILVETAEELRDGTTNARFLNGVVKN